VEILERRRKIAKYYLQNRAPEPTESRYDPSHPGPPRPRGCPSRSESAVAAVAATASAHGRLVPGAGHLLRFLTLGELLAAPVVAATIDGDTGPVVAGGAPAL
jgi:hypothetical protein